MSDNMWHTIKIRLLKRDYTPEQAFHQKYSQKGKNSFLKYTWKEMDDIEIYIGQIYLKKPNWIELIDPYIGKKAPKRSSKSKEGTAEKPEDILSSAAGGIIFVPTRDRILAVCFGHVHLALRLDMFEERFGLEVALGVVPKDRIKSFDIVKIDATIVKRQTQVSKEGSFNMFGIDTRRDLAQSASGIPIDQNSIKFASGKDSLTIDTNYMYGEIRMLCDTILSLYQKEKYIENHSWIDNINPVKDKSIIERLDNNLLEALNNLRNGVREMLYMAPPEVIGRAAIRQVFYTLGNKVKGPYANMSIEDYVNELEKGNYKGSIDSVKRRHRIEYEINGEEVLNPPRKVYDCFIFETSLVRNGCNDFYVLFSGKWYLIDKSYKKNVEDLFKSIDKVNIIGKSSSRNEEELLKSLRGRDDLLVLHESLISPGGVTHGYEFCDVVSKNGDLIHIKSHGYSNTISHLWMQGVVGTESLVCDKEFRTKLRQRIAKLETSKKCGFKKLIPTYGKPINTNNFKVVYGLIRRPYRDGSYGIPFFSKASFQNVANRFQELNIDVAIEYIKLRE